MSRINKFVDKIDFDSNPSLVPNTDAGNLKLYYELSLIRDSYELKCRDDNAGIHKSFDEHVAYYLSIVKEMEIRKLSIPRREKSAIEKAISKSMTAPTTVPDIKPSYHCVHCGNKLTEHGMVEKVCEDCYGRQPGWSLLHDPISKPFGPFLDWDSCMAHMTKPKESGGGGYDTETAKKVCGKMQSELGEKKSSDVHVHLNSDKVKKVEELEDE